MSENPRSETTNKSLGAMETTDVTSTIKEIEEVKGVVDATVLETSLPDKLADLSGMLNNMSEEVDSWKSWYKNDYLAVIETLKSQVEEIQNEWDTVFSSFSTQQEKVESLLQSFPGVIETATLRALTIRVAHLEQLMSQLFSESQAK
jgi:hypothetical protein